MKIPTFLLVLVLTGCDKPTPECSVQDLQKMANVFVLSTGVTGEACYKRDGYWLTCIVMNKRGELQTVYCDCGHCWLGK